MAPLADENGTYPKGTWLRQPAGSVHEPFSEQGCVYYVKNGHFV
ncbi:MAG: cupin domain-containing protein [Proteobacteria bacterium]|nr:cupin domain-containing protein [Pseudomonadota bacterium]